MIGLITIFVRFACTAQNLINVLFCKINIYTNIEECDILLACKSSVYALLPWAFTLILHRNVADGLDTSHRFVLEKKNHRHHPYLLKKRV